MAGDYKFDVFFSYKRQPLTLHWTREVSQRFTHWLTEELGRQAEVFVDEASIEIGQKWPEAMKCALQASRCMVCVWSPSYFQSSWCISEWQSFRAREQMLNMRAHGLIAPLKFHDGEHFPKAARDVQWEDVSAYAFTLPVFWNSLKAVEFEEKLKVFAGSVAKIVRAAPVFDDNWPIVEGTGEAPPKVALAKL